MDKSVETGIDDTKNVFPALFQNKHRTPKISNNFMNKTGGRTLSLMPKKVNSRVGSVEESLNVSRNTTYEDYRLSMTGNPIMIEEHDNKQEY